MDIQLQNGEELLHSSTTNFLPATGGRFTGKLYVTSTRVLFEAQFDTSMDGLSDMLRMVYIDEKQFIEIERKNIKRVEERSGLLMKKVLLHTEKGIHTIDNGVLSVKKIVSALSAQ